MRLRPPMRCGCRSRWKRNSDKIATVDFAVGRFGGHCVGFVRNFNAPRLQIAGLSCNMDTIVDRAALSCILDRLTLLSSGSDRKVAEVFARAEVNRKFCGQRDPLDVRNAQTAGIDRQRGTRSNCAALSLRADGRR